MRAFLAYIIRKTIIVQTYCVHPRNVTSDDEIMLHLLPDNNKLFLEYSFKEHTAEYKINNGTLYDILD